MIFGKVTLKINSTEIIRLLSTWGDVVGYQISTRCHPEDRGYDSPSPSKLPSFTAPNRIRVA